MGGRLCTASPRRMAICARFSDWRSSSGGQRSLAGWKFGLYYDGLIAERDREKSAVWRSVNGVYLKMAIPS